MIDYEVIEFSDCKTTKITTTFYKKGKADPLATTRLVCIPQEVIGAVKQYPYSTHHYLPDVKGLFLLTAEAGLRRSELLTLSTQNLYPTPECFTEIRLFDKDDCPTKYQVGFTVKSQNSIRNIPLSKNSIDFITQQIEKHKNHKIYGVVGNRRAEYQLVEYPFLFPWLDRHLNKWLRLDDFGKSFHSLINFAMEKAGLTLSERYKLHDLRRSVNLWLRKTGFTGEESAYWLGHSKETNETSYLSVKNKQELLYRQTSKDAKELLDFGLPNLKLINNS
jgi:integrase